VRYLWAEGVRAAGKVPSVAGARRRTIRAIKKSGARGLKMGN